MLRQKMGVFNGQFKGGQSGLLVGAKFAELGGIHAREAVGGGA